MSEQSQASLTQFKASLLSLKEKVKKVLKMCESTDFKQVDAFEILTDSLIDVVDIKSLNAKIQLETEDAKDACLNEEHKAEEQNLNYQNYIYQKDNIIKQITACESYQTPEVNQIFPHSDTKVTMEMLKEELDKRKELNTKCEALLQEKEANSNLLIQNRNFINALPHYLKNLETATLQAQKLFNVNITERRGNERLANQLPQPLYVLYYSLISVSELNESSIKIIGDEKDIEAYNLDFPTENEFQLGCDLIDINSKEEGEQSDEGEITIKNNNSKINSRHSPLHYNKLKKLKLHPLAIELSVNSSNKIIFSFLPIANIVCLESISKDYSNEELLSCIFPFRECSYTSLINEKLPQLFNQQSPVNVLFYEYMQILSNNTAYNLNSLLSLCDIDNNTRKDTIAYENRNKNTITMITIDSFVKEITQRVKMLPILKEQINTFVNKSEISPSVLKAYPITFKAKITHFEEITQEDFYSMFGNDSTTEERRKLNYITTFGYDEEGQLYKEIKVQQVRSYNENEAKYFLIEIKRKGIVLKGKLELGFDYPRNNCQSKLSIESSEKSERIPDAMQAMMGEKSKLGMSNEGMEIENEFIKIEKEIEEEMNSHIELNPKRGNNEREGDYSKEYMFSIQIMKLMACVDKLVEISKSDRGLYENLLKGKAKLLPSVFEKNEYLFK